jgi:DNA-binding MarR family transcriptional regulator
MQVYSHRRVLDEAVHMTDNVPHFPTKLLSPTAALLQAQIAVNAAITERATRPAGLEPAIADLLVRLSTAEHHSLRGVDIGRQLMTTATRVSRLIDRAEAQGLVERLPNPTDRRAQNVTLTKSGRDAAERFAPLLTATLKDLLDEAFEDGEIDQLINLLDKITQSAQSITTQNQSLASA